MGTATLTFSLTDPEMARAFDDAISDDASHMAWRLSDGTEVLRVESKLYVRLPHGDVIDGTQLNGETTRAAVDRLRGTCP